MTDMYRFEHPEYLHGLWGLLAIAFSYLIYTWSNRRKLKRWAKVEFHSRLIVGSSSFRRGLKWLLVSLAYTSICVALANPQLGKKFEKVKRQGIDVIIALDVSNSMLAEDVKPNRLERSKQFILKMIDKLQNDRIGLIVFAGNAYLQLPLTIDYSAARLFLRTVQTEMVPTQGTAIGESIRLAMKAFDEEQKKFKTLIIITDGEDNEGEPFQRIDEAVEQGIRVHTIGVGTPKGAPIPVYKNNVAVDFKRDRQNNIVLTKLNEQVLQEMAVKGNGRYFRLSYSNDEMNAIMREISTMEKKDFEERIFTDYEDQFQYFVMLALFFLMLEWMISDRGVRWFSRAQWMKDA